MSFSLPSHMQGIKLFISFGCMPTCQPANQRISTINKRIESPLRWQAMDRYSNEVEERSLSAYFSQEMLEFHLYFSRRYFIIRHVRLYKKIQNELRAFKCGNLIWKCHFDSWWIYNLSIEPFSVDQMLFVLWFDLKLNFLILNGQIHSFTVEHSQRSFISIKWDFSWWLQSEY